MNELDKASIRLKVLDIVANRFEGDAKDIVEKANPIAEWVINGKANNSPEMSGAERVVG